MFPPFSRFIAVTEAYAMVDTCDPAIAGWAEDGLTFIVKDPDRFERIVIPQFFKHSKFSSFVRVSGSLRPIAGATGAKFTRTC